MSQFVDSLHEVFIEFGPIQPRAMFGGYGIYHQGLMFALVADNELFLKVDPASAGWFDEFGLETFTYAKNGKPMKMSYRRAPDDVFDDPLQAKLWAGRAFEAALRARRAKPKRRKSRGD
jgi:DNA transformation protein